MTKIEEISVRMKLGTATKEDFAYISSQIIATRIEFKKSIDTYKENSVDLELRIKDAILDAEVRVFSDAYWRGFTAAKNCYDKGDR
jgi:t-SNARE complex subunit (syntaxin)